MMEIEPHARRCIAIHDPKTGVIRHIIRCRQDHVALQRVPEGPAVADITDMAQFFHDLHPNKHQLHPETKKIIRRVFTAEETAHQRAIKSRDQLDAEIHGGFVSRGRTYTCTRQELVETALTGGYLACNGGALVYHTTEEAKQVMADFVAHRDAAHGRHLERIEKNADRL